MATSGNFYIIGKPTVIRTQPTIILDQTSINYDFSHPLLDQDMASSCRENELPHARHRLKELVDNLQQPEQVLSNLTSCYLCTESMSPRILHSQSLLALDEEEKHCCNR